MYSMHGNLIKLVLSRPSVQLRCVHSWFIFLRTMLAALEITYLILIDTVQEYCKQSTHSYYEAPSNKKQTRPGQLTFCDTEGQDIT